MNGSDTQSRTGPALGVQWSPGHFSASICPKCEQKCMNRTGWEKRHGLLRCASCVAAYDARKAGRVEAKI